MTLKSISDMKRMLSLMVAATMLTLSACSSGDDAVTPTDPEKPDVPTIEEQDMVFHASINPIESGERHQFAAGDIVTVAINGETKEYVADGDDKLRATAPYTWTENDTKEVAAWHFATNDFHPTIGSVKMPADQSQGTAKNDLVYAHRSVEGKSTLRTQPLKFYHQMAQVEVRITMLNGKKVAALQIGNDNIAMEGVFTAPATGNYGQWNTADKKGSIRPEQIAENTFRATLIPQQIEGLEFIVLTMDDGKQLTYVPTSEEGTLHAGERRTFKVTVEKDPDPTPDPETPEEDKMTVESTSSMDWISGGEEDILTSQHALVLVIKGKNITLPMIATATGLPYGLIDWGDGSDFVKYLGGEQHTFATDTEHTITVKTAGATRVEMDNMVGLKRIDLSNL